MYQLTKNKMFKYFKKRREFKESIKGIFDDWEVGDWNVCVHGDIQIRKGKYVLGVEWYPRTEFLLANKGEKNFLLGFSVRERSLLWKIARNHIKKIEEEKKNANRKKINKEFNIK